MMEAARCVRAHGMQRAGFRCFATSGGAAPAAASRRASAAGRRIQNTYLVFWLKLLANQLELLYRARFVPLQPEKGANR